MLESDAKLERIADAMTADDESLTNTMPPDDEPDAHSCSAEADASGVCQVCGALVYMSPAYCDAYGCDPPERRTRYNSFTDCIEDIDD
ncbi:hypothetical protein [Pumilibacter muris]|uniref:hypothetical protein n=1 Tax=Pumilibacter muris TaxID=2941510 RepID=UPI00203E30FD|nr:hypothetical protein [Pumilibacter muris]